MNYLENKRKKNKKIDRIKDPQQNMTLEAISKTSLTKLFKKNKSDQEDHDFFLKGNLMNMII